MLFRRFVYILILGSLPLGAQNIKRLPRASVDAYRLESQYGPEIAVLNPLFPRDSKLEFHLGASYSSLSSLLNYYGVNGSVAWHINRRHAIEPVWIQYTKSRHSSFVNSQIIQRFQEDYPSPETFLSAMGVEQPEWIYSFSYMFSPFYSKLSVTEWNVAHWDIYGLAGIAVLKNKTQLLNKSYTDEKTRVGGTVGVGLRLLMPSRWAIRLDIRDIIYKARNFNRESYQQTFQASLGLSIFFGSFPDYKSL